MIERPKTAEIDELVEKATAVAVGNDHEFVGPEHLLFALMMRDDVKALLTELEVDLKILAADLDAFMDKSELGHTPGKTPKRLPSLIRVIQRTINNVVMQRRSTVYAKDVLVSLMEEERSFAKAFLSKQELDIKELAEAINESLPDEEQPSDDKDLVSALPGMGKKKDTKMNAKKARKLLEQFCRNLNEEATKSKIDPLIGREDEVFSMTLTLARRTKNNVIMVGEPGVGKTQLAEGLAKLIVEGKVPETIATCEVWALDVGAVVAGTRYRGDMEERVKDILQALDVVNNPILFIDEIHTLLGAGGASGAPLDISNMLKPALAKGKLHCIGSTTADEYRKHFEQDRALARRFQKLDIEEPSEDDSIRILQGLKPYYEEFHKVTYTDDAITAAVVGSKRHIQGKFLPDKAIDVIDAAAARQRVTPEDQRKVEITKELAEAEIAHMAKIPPKTVQEGEGEKLNRLSDEIKLMVYEQDEAVDKIVDSVIVSRAGLREHNKPVGVFLLAGPSGTGKTETAKQLAKTLGLHFEKLDMSEFMEEHTVSKLIGSPPGYVGYEENGGRLINTLETHPHSVVLLDEVEKAHPKVLNVFLQVFDDGKITSSHEKTVSATNTIFILTSNAGAADAEKRSIGFGAGTNDGAQEEAVKKFFTPEFRNRLDAVVYFRKLSDDGIKKVLGKFIGIMNTQIKDQNVVVRLTPAAEAFLVKEGYDPTMGARPMARTIDLHIKKPLARQMLFGDLKKGGTAEVDIEVIDGKDTVVIRSMPHVVFTEATNTVAA